VTVHEVDVAVVGAGPAGLAAALAATEAGVTVALVDGAPRPGGQYWRSPAPELGPFRPAKRFAATNARLAESDRLLRLFTHHVWSIVPAVNGWSVHCRLGAEPRQHGTAGAATVAARRLVLATGAYDRQLPFPGWDLPGVTTAGGAQALLKGHLVAAGGTAVVAGTGPFLLPVATGLANHGTRVAAVVEANSPLGFARSPRAWPGGAGKLGEVAGYARQLLRHRVPVRHRQIVVAATGKDRLTGVLVGKLDRAGRLIPYSVGHVACDLLAVGWGFTPQLELPLQVGCATRLDTDDSLVVAVDEHQATSVAGVWAAGEATGIGGADLATVEGRIAGRAAAASLGATAGDDRPPHRRRSTLRAFAAAMHRVYRVPEAVLDWCTDETLVCRCEEVSAGTVRHAVKELGATDARTVKLLARPGMGWCQGRVCGFATACLTARHTGRPLAEADLHAFADRPIATPIPLGALADLTPDEPPPTNVAT
jgi:NADPH-dependent 2,4-dienoyl-CoA reductase/sulfur reductase-like enzyme